MSPYKPLPTGDRQPPEPRRIGEVVDRLVQGLGAPSAGAFGAVFSRWPEVVGEQVAAHAKPLSLHDGRLVVAVEEPGWATQLRYLESDLLCRLGEACGDGVVRSIEVRVRPA
jgi:predicted nucleic acid-binding Zn ribbon protein